MTGLSITFWTRASQTRNPATAAACQITQLQPWFSWQGTVGLYGILGRCERRDSTIRPNTASLSKYTAECKYMQKPHQMLVAKHHYVVDLPWCLSRIHTSGVDYPPTQNLVGSHFPSPFLTPLPFSLSLTFLPIITSQNPARKSGKHCSKCGPGLSICCQWISTPWVKKNKTPNSCP